MLHQLAVIAKHEDPNQQQHGFQLLVTPCPFPIGHQGFHSSPSASTDLPFKDIPLFDLPFTPLSTSSIPVQLHDCAIAHDVQCALHSIGLAGFDVVDAVCRLKTQLSSIWELMQPWKFWKLLEEPEYGPGAPLCTAIFMTEFQLNSALLPGAAHSLNSQDAWALLTGGNAGKIRLGPLAAFAFSPHFPEGLLYKFNLTAQGQEYPPGVLVLPLNSSIPKPFTKTNITIFASMDTFTEQNPHAVTIGDALIMDPGCHSSEAKEKLSTIVGSLPRKLLIFLTHHHQDHTEGLPTIQKQNPEALIIAHELTIQRLGKVAGRLKHLVVTDGSMLFVGNQELRVIAAPGHTDGHLALLHVPTHTLVVGDHCLGQGSSLLDAKSGGNMQDFLTTTRRFLELSPRVIVPMHGHFNVWPAHMLCNYIRHREAREAKILNAIERGAQTAFGVVSEAYSDVPTLWMHALSNAILHVDHLNQLGKLPSGFSISAFRKSCGYVFYLRCISATLSHSFFKSENPDSRNKLIGQLSVALLMGSVCYIWMRRNSSS